MKIVISDRQQMFLDAMGSALVHARHDIAGATTDTGVLHDLVVRRRPDLCLFEVDLEVSAVVEVASELRAGSPGTRVVLLTGHATDQVWDAFGQRFLDGVLSKRCSFLVVSRAIGQVGDGRRVVEGFVPPQRGVAPRTRGVGLTPREGAVVSLLVAGRSTDEMAEELDVSVHTVRSHVQRVLDKYGVDSRCKVARLASSHGHVPSR